MKAIISGEAGAAAILERTVEFRPTGGKPVGNLRPYDVSRAFDGCHDVRLVDVKSKSEADRLAHLAWAEDRALRLFLFLFDPEVPEEELIEYGECVEELISQEGVLVRLEQRLLANTIPRYVEIRRIERATASNPKTSDLFNRLLSLQSSVARVRQAFDQVEAEQFGGELEKNDCRAMMIDDGSIRNLVLAVAGEHDLSFMRLKLVAAHRIYAQAIVKFVAHLQPTINKIVRPVTYEPDFDDPENDTYDAALRDGDFEAYLNVRTQQKGIIDKLKIRDINSARRFAAQLVNEQRRMSNKEHIAKSLCLLAQAAKQYEVPELQLEWAQQANKVDSDDPRTSGHLADALICTGNFVDAYEAINQTERRGDPLYAATSRARIRRMEGRYDEANALYLNAARTYDAHRDAVFAWAGVAETLRDMGQYNQALSQYERLVRRWPHDGPLRSGFASALMDVGRYYDAIREFNIALQQNGGIVAENGRATAFKLLGETTEALRLYEQILEDSPCNAASLCGRAEVYRANDDLFGAQEAYKVAVDRAPHSPRTWAGLGSTFEDLGMYEEAKKLYAEAEKRFQGDEFIAVGKARVLKREGAFEAALSAFDELSKRFPFNRWVKWALGDVLRKMGHREAALEKMESILSTWPEYTPAQRSKASLLIEAGRLSEASTVLDEHESLFNDWSAAVLRAAISRARGRWNDALITLTDSLSEARLPRERRYIRCAIAALDLQQGRPEAAAMVAESKIGEITKVIHFHALAASGKHQKAKDMYDQISQREADTAYTGIVVEIARRFHITSEKPLHSREWISRQEEKALLQEVG